MSYKSVQLTILNTSNVFNICTSIYWMVPRVWYLKPIFVLSKNKGWIQNRVGFLLNSGARAIAKVSLGSYGQGLNWEESQRDFKWIERPLKSAHSISFGAVQKICDNFKRESWLNFCGAPTRFQMNWSAAEECTLNPIVWGRS